MDNELKEYCANRASSTFLFSIEIHFIYDTHCKNFPLVLKLYKSRGDNIAPVKVNFQLYYCRS